jgi:geranylgeranyl reductase family protein
MKNRSDDSDKYDVAVVGGGPAGASSAYYAAKLGLKTILFEKQAYPREKPCGGALSERSVPLLGTHAVRAINCHMEELHLYAPSFKRFVSDPLPGRFVIRREFDHALAKDARQAGVELREDTPVKTIQPPAPPSAGNYTIISPDSIIKARYVILATGYQNNLLVKQLKIREKWEKDYLAMCMVSETPIDNEILVSTDFAGKVLGIFFGAVPNGYGWYFVKDGYINIGVGATAMLVKDLGIKNAYTNFVKNLKEKELLPGELELAKPCAFPLPFKKTAEKTVFGNVLLVGDSAGFVSPVTGEGLYYSLRGGQLAAEAIDGNLRNGTPLTAYRENCLKDFGNDLNKHGYFLRERLYKSRWRMEFAVAFGRHDKTFAEILKKMIVGTYTYGKTIRKALLRLPITLFKMVFMKKV